MWRLRRLVRIRDLGDHGDLRFTDISRSILRYDLDLVRASLQRRSEAIRRVGESVLDGPIDEHGARKTMPKQLSSIRKWAGAILYRLLSDEAERRYACTSAE